jgi:hypothetical protein
MVKLTGEQVITAMLARGMYMYMDGGKLKMGFLNGSRIPKEAVEWLRPYKEKIIKALDRNNAYRLDREIRSGLGGCWLKDHMEAMDRLKGKVSGWTDQRYRLTAWAMVLATERLSPGRRRDEEETPSPVETVSPVKVEEGEGPESERRTGRLPVQDMRRWAV